MFNLVSMMHINAIRAHPLTTLTTTAIKSCRVCLPNHIGSIIYIIMLLVTIVALGVNTHTYVHVATDVL